MRNNTEPEAPDSAENQPACAALAGSGKLIVIAGQAGAAGDFEEQLAGVIEKISKLLGLANATLQDLVKLVIFYLPARGVAAQQLRERLSACLPSSQGIVLTLVPLRELTSPDSMVEIEAYAMVDVSGGELRRQRVTLADLPPPGDTFCHGVRCGEMVFVGGQAAQGSDGQAMFADLPRQNRQVLANIDRILEALGAERSDIVKANTWRLPPPDANQYRSAAQDRFTYFAAARPAVTGITLPDVAGDNLLITIDAWAMRNPDNSVMPRQPIQPARHWDWSVNTPYSQGLRCGRYLFVGGQAALDQSGCVLQPGNVVSQTHKTMDYVDDILRAAEGSFENVIKLNTLYVAGENASNYQSCLETRNRYIQASKAASTAIPVDALAYPGQVVEIEAIAILDS